MHGHENESVDSENNYAVLVCVFIKGKLCIIKENNTFIREEGEELRVKTLDKDIIK